MTSGARLRGASATVLIASIVLALLLGSYLIHTWRTTAPFADPLDTFVGSLGLLLPAVYALWRRSRPQPPATAPTREQWLTHLADAELDRLREDLRDRDVEVARIAVPWEAAPGLADDGPTAAASAPPGSGRVDRLRQELWPDGGGPARVVVCGPAGSGKSIALHLLAECLLTPGPAGRTAGDPVPVVLSLAGWEAHRPLYTWLIAQLTGRYPTVVGPDSGVDAADLARALRDGTVVPFLDGFDEMAAPARPALLRALNRAVGPTLPVALASREEQFREAVAAAGPVRGSTAIRLRPLSPEHFDDFLTASRAPNRPAWRPLLDEMRAGRAAPARDAFTTPLMQWLGLQVYRAGTASPLELADATRFPTAEDVERHLLASLVPAVFDPLAGGPAGGGRRWSARRARRLLRFLAEQPGEGGIQWWLLHRRAQGRLAVVHGVLLTSLAVGISALSRTAGTAAPAGALWGTACGASFAVAYAITRGEEYRRRFAVPGGFRSEPNLRVVLPRVARVLPVLAVAGAAVHACTGLLFAPPNRPALWALLGQGTVLSVVAGLCGGFAAGILLDRVHTLDANAAPANAVRPGELLRRDAKATAAVALSLAVATALVTWISWSLVRGRTPPAVFLTVAAASAAVIGPGMFTAWPVFRAAHLWYVVCDRLPLRYGAFMTAAQDAGVLREEGVRYHFRHALLRAALRRTGRPPTGGGGSGP